MASIGRATGAAAALLLFACSTESGSDPKNEVVIGALYPLTGAQQATGEDLRRGVELATEIVNGDFDLDLPLGPGVGLPGLGGARLRIEFADTEDTPARGVEEARRLVSERVAALIGAYSSGVTSEVSLVAEEAGLPFVTPESTAPVLTRRGLRWFFRTTADDTLFVANLFQFLDEIRSSRGIDPASAAIVFEDGLFGSSVAQLERDAARSAGLPVVADVGYPVSSTDFASLAEQVRDSGAALVLQSSFEQDAIGTVRAYAASGYRPEGILAMDAGFTSPAFVRTLGAAADGILTREVWAEDLAQAKPLVGQVNDLFRQRFGTGMTGNSARAFTGVLVVADAISRAGSTDPERIRQALLETDLPASQLIVPWDGVRFDPATGQNTLASGIVVQIQDGTYRTVWPPGLAAAELIWPLPPLAP